jgi:hypothetical protein
MLGCRHGVTDAAGMPGLLPVDITIRTVKSAECVNNGCRQHDEGQLIRRLQRGGESVSDGGRLLAVVARS